MASRATDLYRAFSVEWARDPAHMHASLPPLLDGAGRGVADDDSFDQLLTFNDSNNIVLGYYIVLALSALNLLAPARIFKLAPLSCARALPLCAEWHCTPLTGAPNLPALACHWHLPPWAAQMAVQWATLPLLPPPAPRPTHHFAGIRVGEAGNPGPPLRRTRSATRSADSPPASASSHRPTRSMSVTATASARAEAYTALQPDPDSGEDDFEMVEVTPTVPARSHHAGHGRGAATQSLATPLADELDTGSQSTTDDASSTTDDASPTHSDSSASDDQYIVAAILDSRIEDGVVKYETVWQGWPGANSWERFSNFNITPATHTFFAAFHTQHPSLPIDPDAAVLIGLPPPKHRKKSATKRKDKTPAKEARGGRTAPVAATSAKKKRRRRRKPSAFSSPSPSLAATDPILANPAIVYDDDSGDGGLVDDFETIDLTPLHEEPAMAHDMPGDEDSAASTVYEPILSPLTALPKGDDIPGAIVPLAIKIHLCSRPLAGLPPGKRMSKAVAATWGKATDREAVLLKSAIDAWEHGDRSDSDGLAFLNAVLNLLALPASTLAPINGLRPASGVHTVVVDSAPCTCGPSLCIPPIDLGAPPLHRQIARSSLTIFLWKASTPPRQVVPLAMRRQPPFVSREETVRVLPPRY